MNARTDRFFLLDSLRGVAALAVLVTHVAWVTVGNSSGFRPYQARLEAAFAVFFVISGFLLYRPFVKARLLDRDPLPALAYGWRRFLRIVPAFWVAVTAIALWQGMHIWTPREIAANYGFLQLYRGGSPLNVIPQAWTLCVEVTFYASLPIWAAMMRRLPARDFAGRLRWEVAGVAFLIFGSLAYNAVLAFGHVVEPIPFEPKPLLAALPGYFDHLGLGMLLAIISVCLEGRDRLPQPLAALARFPFLCWVVAALAVWVGASRIGLTGASGELYTPLQYMERHLLNCVIAVAVVIPAVFGDSRAGLTRRILGNPVFVYLGLISYGFYLFHLAVLDQLVRWDFQSVHITNPFIQWYVAVGLGAAVLGSLSYYVVERPALSLKRLVPPRPRPSRDEALAEPAPAVPVTARQT